MLITKDFIYIHLHKTGGQTLNKIITATQPGVEVVGYHYPFSEIPPGHESLPIVGIVRNPWDWYVSWYAFNVSLGEHKSALTTFFNIMSDGGHADLKTTVSNLVNLGSDSTSSRHYRNALIAVFPDTLEGNLAVGLTKNCVRDLARSGQGYYSWLIERMYGPLDSPRLRIGRFENLENDFIGIMESIGVDNVQQVRAQFAPTGRVNSSRHDHYSNYIDAELQALIAEKEQVVVDRFDYQFEQQLSPHPVPIACKKEGDFRKLEDGAINYLKITDDIDVAPIIRVIEGIDRETWAESQREIRYAVHADTQSLKLMHDRDFRHVYPTTWPLFDTFKDAISPILDIIEEHFGPDGEVIRIVLAKLKAGGVIPPHSDAQYSLRHCHRLHIPIVTNPAVDFFVGGEKKNMGVGEMWEINNSTTHTVENHSSLDRIHLIIDWAPGFTVREEERQQILHRRFVEEHRELLESNRIGRNSPCPCNSGLKYKNCHGKI
jgi:quercetin dioxygenase-like cupin family protein